jgi:hypothetical protein
MAMNSTLVFRVSCTYGHVQVLSRSLFFFYCVHELGVGM